MQKKIKIPSVEIISTPIVIISNTQSLNYNSISWKLSSELQIVFFDKKINNIGIFVSFLKTKQTTNFVKIIQDS